MTLTEIQNLLNGLMRSIDKKTSVTVQLSAEEGRPTVTVHLSRDRRKGSLQVQEAELVAGQTDLARRHRLRTALKRTHDSMWEQTGYIFETKMGRPKSEGSHWFNPSQGGRGGRR